MSSSLFYTGLSGLNVAQAALVTTGHNTANVGTPGYSRQSVQVASMPGLYAQGVGFFGAGARAVDVQRSHSAYLGTQLHQAQASRDALATYQAQVSQIDNLLADPDAGLAPQLQTFFAHVQAVANTPADTAARQQMLSSAQALASQFRSMDASLGRLDLGINEQLQVQVEQVNSVTEQIAHLNRQITRLSSATGTQAPNDLLDQRDQLVGQLGQLLGSRLVVQDGGSYNLFIGNGQPLVLGQEFTRLAAVASSADPSRQALALVHASGRRVELQDSAIASGQMGGLLKFRQETLVPTQNALGRMALGLASAMNAQQALGRDLQGGLGQPLYASGGPQALAHQRNQGDLQLAVDLADVGALSTSDYRLKVTDSGGALQYTLTRLADQKDLGRWPATGFPVSVDGFTLRLASGSAQAGDAFLIQPTRTGARDLQALLLDPARVAAAAPITTAATPGNRGTGRISAGSVDAAFLAAPLAAPLTLSFDATTGSLSGFPAGAQVEVTTASGTTAHPIAASTDAVPYAAGASYRFGGMRVQFQGDPAHGDSFIVQPSLGAVSDGRNALRLGALQTAKVLGGGTASLGEAFGQIVSSVGNKTRQVEVALGAQSALSLQIRGAAQAVSGVNQDEETAHLLMFQQMYQANAKVIQAAATMFDAVLGIAR